MAVAEPDRQSGAISFPRVLIGITPFSFMTVCLSPERSLLILNQSADKLPTAGYVAGSGKLLRSDAKRAPHSAYGPVKMTANISPKSYRPGGIN